MLPLHPARMSPAPPAALLCLQKACGAQSLCMVAARAAPRVGLRVSQARRGAPVISDWRPAGSQTDGPSAIESLLQSDFQTGFTTVMSATAILWWPDQAAGSAAMMCRYLLSGRPPLSAL